LKHLSIYGDDHETPDVHACATISM
jgi:hypothetical protein